MAKLTTFPQPTNPDDPFQMLRCVASAVALAGDADAAAAYDFLTWLDRREPRLRAFMKARPFPQHFPNLDMRDFILHRWLKESESAETARSN